MPLRKLILTPFFGDLPPWFDKFEVPKGYDWIMDRDLEKFKVRVRDKLGIEYPGIYGSPKVWDYRCTLGVLYEEEIKGYDFFGHCDLDMVFGRVDKWFPDEQLNELDIWSNHDTYICGPWTLYRNTEQVCNLFRQQQDWELILSYPESTAWVENGYSRLVEQSGLRYKYSFMQGDPYHPPFNLIKVAGKLFQDGEEIAMLHFRRDKHWPL